MFKLVIDVRERDLYAKINQLISQDKKLESIVVEQRNLELGDISVESIEKDSDSDEIQNCRILVERKKINDLASSITDGRYKEQSYRLFHNSIPNHNIMYLIEGRVCDLNTRYSRVSHSALYSAMIVLQYYKGFSVFRTLDLDESAQWLVRMVSKINRENKLGFYDGMENPFKDVEYTQVVKTRKKENVTPENIGVIILSQIPNISNVTAVAIMEHFESLENLLLSLHENKRILEEVKYKNSNGQTRRLTVTAKDNVINYLLYKKEKVIEVSDTS